MRFILVQKLLFFVFFIKFKFAINKVKDTEISLTLQNRDSCVSLISSMNVQGGLENY